MTTNANLLLIEDDPALQRSIRRGLSEQGYSIQLAADLASANRLAAEAAFDLVLLDLGLPDGSGYDFLAAFRRNHATTPVIILTALDKIPAKIKGLDLGADDYLVKPFNFQELTARMRAHLRRSTSHAGATIAVADLEIDLVSRTVRRGGQLIECTPREIDVLVFLARSPGQAISREMLTTEVWKVQSRMTSMDNVIDVLMSRLREKIDEGHPVKLIHTVRGLGFMIRESP